jgi:hypothetical protein
MKLSQKFKICLVFPILISLACTSAFAEEPMPVRPTFTQLEKDQPAPFKVWCFNESATARMIGALEFAQRKCEVQVQLALERQTAVHALLIGNLNLRIGTAEEKHKNVLKIKDEEMQRLSAAALKRPNDYTHWWGIGGFFIGATSVVVLLTVLDTGGGIL